MFSLSTHWYTYNWVLAHLIPGGADGLASRPGVVEIFLVASCYRNWDTLGPDGSLGSYADLSFTLCERLCALFPREFLKEG